MRTTRIYITITGKQFTSSFILERFPTVICPLIIAILLTTSCSRYNYIPRHHQLFATKHKKCEHIEKIPVAEDMAKLLKTNENFYSDSVHTRIVHKIENDSIFNVFEGSNKITSKPSSSCLTKENSPPLDYGIVREIKPCIESKTETFKVQMLKHSNNPRVKNLLTIDGDNKSALADLSIILALLAIAALLIGILSRATPFLALLSIILALGALVTGIIALRKSRNNKNEVPNRPNAVLGIVLSGILILFYCIAMIAFIFADWG